jgi:hypothetical protein
VRRTGNVVRHLVPHIALYEEDIVKRLGQGDMVDLQ